MDTQCPSLGDYRFITRTHNVVFFTAPADLPYFVLRLGDEDGVDKKYKQFLMEKIVKDIKGKSSTNFGSSAFRILSKKLSKHFGERFFSMMY